MSYGSLKQIHESIDGIGEELRRIKSSPSHFTDEIDVADYPTMCTLIHDLYHGGEDWNLGVNSTIQRKFREFRGQIRQGQAIAVAERLLVFLNNQDQLWAGFTPPEMPETHQETAETELEAPTQPQDITPLKSDHWIHVEHRQGIKAKLLEISEAIDDVLLLAANPNLPPDMAALTKIERAQLVALLETALAIVKSPMVETGLLRSLKNKSKEIAKKTATKKAEEGLGFGLNALAKMILDLLSRMG